jgi:hypothetical protein
MRAEKLTLVFRFNTLEVDFALQQVQSVLSSLGTEPIGFQMSGVPLANLSEVSGRLRRRDRATFHITGNGYEFDLGRVRNCDLDFLLMGYRGNQEFEWDIWAAQFLPQPSFVMAWTADRDYDFWQNAYDPLQYSSRHQPYDHLPMKSNGLPYPLEQKIIDTSNNPGRCTLRRGYHEAVGHVMWLGVHFWDLVGTDRRQVETAPDLSRSYPSPGVLRIQAFPHCFRTAVGESGRMQRLLRELLFRKDESETSALEPSK